MTNEELVMQILEKHECARKDDFILYGFVLKHYGIDLNMSLRTFLQNTKNLGVPSFKSIERTRRDIQHYRPYLADPNTMNARLNEEEKYLEKYGHNRI